MFFLEILTSYILPIIYDSFVSLVLVLFFLFIFRIKDSNIRILFFFLPLIKPFIVIAEKIDLNELLPQGAFGIRFPDPLNFIQKFHIFNYEIIELSKINNLILLIIIISIVITLIIRWTNLALFYRSLAHEEKVGRKEVPEIYSTIDKYIKKIKTKTPDVSLTYNKYLTPFIVGIKNYTLVLSPVLMEKLNNGEKETMIQHELSHIKRNDNLIGWIALIIRDLNFFNPFAHISYYLIKIEQEKASDKLMVKYSKKSPKEAAKNFLNSILKINKIYNMHNKEKISPIFSSHFHIRTIFNHKIIQDRVKNILRSNPVKIYSRILPKILMYVLFMILLIIQITTIVKFEDIFIFLR